jgi:aromatic-L-amino-acid decarboxylase
VARRPDPVPDLDWSPERARELGEAALGVWVELLERVRELPVNRDFRSDPVRAAVALPIPDEPLELDAILAHLRTVVFDQSMYIGHPGFLGYIVGAGTVPGAVADLVAAGLNPNSGGWRLSPAASEIELALVRWLAAQFGLPPTAGGHIVTGGAVANLVGLKAARDRAMGEGARERGVRHFAPLAVYASVEAHAVIRRAADILGLGSDAVRALPVDDRWRLRPEAVVPALEADREAGVAPMAVVATAGTTATGSIDPLAELAEISERYGAWLHVDAAYGGAAVLADDLRPEFAGIERADSLAVDPHKWLYTPQSGGCVLVRDASRLAASFAADASYIWQAEEAREGIDLGQLGPQFSRGFAALKIWLSLLAHGRSAYARRISHDAALARYLAELVQERDDFELMAPPSLSVCCFRYAPASLAGDDAALNRLNEQVMTAIQVDGRTYCSNAVLDGRFSLRACVTNFRTEAPDLELLLDVAAEHGERLMAGPAALSRGR